MNYVESTTDASYLYRPTTAADNDQYSGTAAKGNLSDMIKNDIVIRTYMVQVSIVPRAPISWLE